MIDGTNNMPTGIGPLIGSEASWGDGALASYDVTSAVLGTNVDVAFALMMGSHTNAGDVWSSEALDAAKWPALVVKYER